jgi:hypothetical protein
MDGFLIQPYYPLPFGMLDSITTFGLSKHRREIPIAISIDSVSSGPFILAMLDVVVNSGSEFSLTLSKAALVLFYRACLYILITDIIGAIVLFLISTSARA